jgi:pimeloyl-ACP methyl ester carboxylesterase
MLACERIGSGAPLVLVHGIGHRRQAWYPVVDLLGPHRELILVDLPGHGESPELRVNGMPVTDALRESFREFLADQGLVRPHLAGNSLGGMIALEAGARGDACSVTALSPAGFWPTPRSLNYAKSVFRVTQGLARRLGPVAPVLSRSTAGRAAMFGWLVTRPGNLNPERVMGDLRSYLAAAPAVNTILGAELPPTPVLPSELPVTIAWAKWDLLLPRNQAKVARTRYPHANHVLLPRCGHVPMSDDPELVARVLLRGSERGTPGAVLDSRDRHAG